MADKKSVIIGAIITIVTGIIIALFTFYISKSTVNIKYTLSEKIILNSQGQGVQQLLIKNLGNTTAEKIIIDLIGDIKSYSIEKKAESDNVGEFSKVSGFQIIYPELAPQSSIKIAITSIGIEGIKVSISHSKGVGEEALSSTNNSNSSIIIAFIYFGMFFLYLILNIQNAVVYYWSNFALYNERKILKRTKAPIFLSKKWDKIRKIAIVEIVKDIIHDTWWDTGLLESRKSYIYLNNENLSSLNLSEEEKSEITKIAQETFTLALNTSKVQIYDLDRFSKLLSVNRPELLM